MTERTKCREDNPSWEDSIPKENWQPSDFTAAQMTVFPRSPVVSSEACMVHMGNLSIKIKETIS
jgi:hypothetical protein